ncbi:uncharacterized protein LOC132936152 [Metopolophium dirhodum]|uniref:uncharacterized protein LOC132936152 n=1 Tax=Metopolophium dirhodum TaxID=44670 RepID=UPI00298FFF82|nr:uncharacterized protein LOC132936152 [Metopolophium dirhodum]
MDTKRKHSASYEHTRTKSKKSNTGTENTLRTSSSQCTGIQRASMSAIDLNVANSQEQVSGLPSAWTENYAVGQDVLDITLTTSSSESDGPHVIFSGGEQDNGNNYNYNSSQDDEAMEDRSSTLSTCSRDSDNHLDDESRTSVIIENPKNSHQYTDDELNTTYSECSTAVTSRVSHLNNGYDYYKTTNDQEINNSRLKSTTYSYKTNCFGCYCVDLNKDYSDDGPQTTNNIGATEHTNTFQCGDDKINASTSEWSTASTSVGQQDNGYKYNQTQNYEEMNDTRSKSSTETLRGSTLITSIREQENGCFVYLTEYDGAMNEICSNVYTIEKPTMPILKKPLSSFVVMSL